MRDLPEPTPDGEPADAGALWRDALLAAALVAVDPAGLGGVWLQAGPGHARDAWIAALRRLMPASAPWQRLPMSLDIAALSCGPDLGLTLATGRRVETPGPAARADGGVLLLPGAEGLDRGAAGALAQILDTGRAPGAVHGPGAAARLALIAFDESAGEGEGLPPALADRLAFRLALDAVPLAVTEGTLSPLDAADVAGARARLDRIDVPPALQEAMVVAALRYGVFSLRAVVLALRAARAQAALTGGAEVGEAAAAAALRLVILPRATCLPMEEAPEEAPTEEAPPPDATPPEDPPPEDPSEGEDQPSSAEEIQAMADRLLEAVHAELPPEVLASMAGGARRGRARGDGAGQRRLGTQRGRPAGVRPGVPGQGRRLALTQTLAAAAPWQALRRRAPGQRLAIRRDDLRIRRFKTPRETLTIFAVDASGSAALARLAEAKGAVELLLAEAYRRRDLVALVAFRGTRAEVLLPPTRALARARRALAALPGGGATPLGAGIDAAAVLARDAIQRGQDAQVILLTDGKGNVARDGTEGRAAARADTAAAAAAAARAGLDALVIDTAPRPAREARALAEAMAARYLALPGAQAETIAKAARAGLEVAR